MFTSPSRLRLVRRLPALALLALLARPGAAAAYDPWPLSLDPVRAAGLHARLSGEELPFAPVAPYAQVPIAPEADVPATTLAASGWEAIPPPARWVHSTIYDPLRDRLVVFGGQSYTGNSNETWAFYLGGIPHWQKLSPSGTPPSPRGFQSAIYDSLRDRMIVFGGSDASSVSKNEVWALSFAGNPTWSLLAPTGAPPAPRKWHSAVYDRARDRMLVMGGQVGGVSVGDVWAMSLAGTPAWTQLAPAGPSPGGRSAHAAVYDASADRLVIFGGLDAAGQPRNDAWSLALAGTPTWSQLLPAGAPPSARYGVAGLYDRVRQRMVVFAGGTGAPNQNDAWTLSFGASPVWTALKPSNAPQGRQFHSVSYDPIGDRMLAFGGSSGTILSDTWALPLAAPTAWVPLSGTRRKGHSALYDSARGRMVVFGGENATTLNDVWDLSLGNVSTWSRLAPNGTPPTPRTLQGAIYEPTRDRIIIFGGRDSAPLNDAWELSFSGELAWLPLAPVGAPPTPREDVAAAYDEQRSRLMVFGGADLGGVYNEVWALSLSGTPTWTRLTPAGTAPSARGGAHMIYDHARDRLVVYGGFDHLFLPIGDVYALTLSGTPTWTKLIPTGTAPAPRFAGAAIYDPTRDRFLVSGGTDFDQYFSDTFALNFTGATGAGWTPLTFAGTTPSSRSDHRAIYDVANDRMVFFGGQSLGGILHETWALDFANTVDVPPAPSAPARVTLEAARPNPARSGSGTTLGFALPRAMSRVELALFDVSGRRVAVLARGAFEAGAHPARWDGNDEAGRRVPTGVYFARLVTEDGVATGKVVVAR